MTTARPGLLARPYAFVTAGSWVLVFLAAFEALAVTTIMPVVTADLDGRSLYSLAFAATLAAGVVGMVVAGSWADRRGPAVPLVAAVAVFAVGLALAGSAASMPVFVLGRFLQGLGAGGETVALYVLIARVYPPRLHIRIVGAFASAWVLPSMVGPFVAGLVSDAVGWHWVFLGVLVPLVVAAAMVLPAVRAAADAPVPGARVGPPVDAARLASAVAVASAVVVLSASGELATGPAVVTAAVALLVVAVAARGLLPAGTYRARPGIAAAVLLYGTAGAVFVGTEVYLPLMLHDRYGLPARLSGLTLTAAAVAWALASAVQGRLGEHRAVPALRAGAALLAAGVLTELATVALGLHPALVAAGWFLAGAGMGTLYPRISVLVLTASAPDRQGFNTAAKSIADSVGGSVALALTGLLFPALGDAATRWPYVGVLLVTAVLAVVAQPLAGRAVPAGWAGRPPAQRPAPALGSRSASR